MSASLNFSISADQEALVKAARRFGEQHLAPFYKQREIEGAYDRQTLCHMGELGLFCIELPEHYGGLGLDCVTAGLVLEALCRSDYNIGHAILSRHGQPEIVDRYLKDVVGERIIPAIALTEPGGGSDAANLRLRARRDGDTYILDGEKTSTSFATQAGFAVVW